MSQTAVSRQIAVVAFSPLEEEFFAAGDALSAEVETDHADGGGRTGGLWRQLWRRVTQRASE